ncbi:MFS transporter [Pseudodesulfovibrio portus]|uniref:MFS transporter n=1 Tax=Pseudodesulfovibrio portus TaxID=231439 RepID=A0ABM8AR84_9BACT|nr:MFS transporter [Pseudodesulfovibrio portus]BDQ33927.1 MFS transporter [Pseudodesulfovibrio portus]
MNTPSRRRGVLFAVAATQFAAPFMISSVGIVLPAIGRDFQASGVALSMVESVFLGVNAMFLLAFGRASDLMGRNWIFTLGLIIFCLSTVALGFSPTIHAMIAIRALQALGGAMQVSTGLAILMDVYPSEERGRVLGISLACIYLGLSTGPFMGGYLADILGWRWLFFLCVVPCLAALVQAFRALKWDFRRLEVPFDYAGALASMVCIGLLLSGGANMDTDYGFPLLGGSLAALAVFLRIESRRENPLLDLGLFKGNVDFSFGNLLQFLNYSATFGLTFLMSLFLQLGHGMTPLHAGTILVVQPLVQSVLSPLCGRLADRYPPEPLVTAGMLLSMAGLGWASTFDAATSMASVIVMLAVMGVGIALFVSPNMKTIMGSVPPKSYGVATAITGQMRIIGMTFSMVAISMVISVIIGDRVLDTDVFDLFNRVVKVVLGGGCVVGALGMLLSLAASRRKRRAARKSVEP